MGATTMPCSSSSCVDDDDAGERSWEDHFGGGMVAMQQTVTDRRGLRLRQIERRMRCEGRGTDMPGARQGRGMDPSAHTGLQFNSINYSTFYLRRILRI